MKVLMLNGSPHEKGCVFTALSEVASELEKYGVESEIFQMGKKPVMGCISCNACAKTGKCFYNDDRVNECAEKLREADAFIIGSPVYYAGPNGALCAFLDRLFYSSSGYEGKPGACVVNCRRGGASAAFDRLNKYFTISNMPVIPSQYWNSTHGRTPEQVKLDFEGMQTMRTLAKNTAWMLQTLSAKEHPGYEKHIYTDFIPRIHSQPQ